MPKGRHSVEKSAVKNARTARKKTVTVLHMASAQALRGGRGAYKGDLSLGGVYTFYCKNGH